MRWLLHITWMRCPNSWKSVVTSSCEMVDGSCGVDGGKLQIMQATGSYVSAMTEQYGMLSVDNAGILDVFAARVRVLAVTGVQIEEKETLEMSILRVDAVTLHVLVPDVGIVNSGKETRTRPYFRNTKPKISW